LAALKTDGARLLYTWLIPHLQSNACFSGDPVVVNGKVFTRLNKKTETVDEYLKDLEGVGLIKRFDSNGDVFLQVLNFKQPVSFRPDREAPPSIPTPELVGSNSRLTPPNVIEEKRREEKCLFSFEILWVKYPKDKDGLRKGKKEAERHFIASVKTEQDWKDINRAIEKYAKSETVLKGFVKNGSTWFNNWRDYIPPPEKPRVIPKPIPRDDTPLTPEEQVEFEKARKDWPRLPRQIGKPMPSAQGMRPEVQKALEEERSKR
jgi:hypothetical protein